MDFAKNCYVGMIVSGGKGNTSTATFRNVSVKVACFLFIPPEPQSAERPEEYRGRIQRRFLDPCIPSSRLPPSRVARPSISGAETPGSGSACLSPWAAARLAHFHASTSSFMVPAPARCILAIWIWATARALFRRHEKPLCGLHAVLRHAFAADHNFPERSVARRRCPVPRLSHTTKASLLFFATPWPVAYISAAWICATTSPSFAFARMSSISRRVTANAVKNENHRETSHRSHNGRIRTPEARIAKGDFSAAADVSPPPGLSKRGAW